MKSKILIGVALLVVLVVAGASFWWLKNRGSIPMAGRQNQDKQGELNGSPLGNGDDKTLVPLPSAAGDIDKDANPCAGGKNCGSHEITFRDVFGVVDTNGWQLYQDSDYGFSFMRPGDWRVEESAADWNGAPIDRFSLEPKAQRAHEIIRLNIIPMTQENFLFRSTKNLLPGYFARLRPIVKDYVTNIKLTELDLIDPNGKITLVAFIFEKDGYTYQFEYDESADGPFRHIFLGMVSEFTVFTGAYEKHQPYPSIKPYIIRNPHGGEWQVEQYISDKTEDEFDVSSLESFKDSQAGIWGK